MSGNSGRYKTFLDVYIKTHPNLLKDDKYKNAQTEWNCVKDDGESYDKAMTYLLTKAEKSCHTVASLWSKEAKTSTSASSIVVTPAISVITDCCV